MSRTHGNLQCVICTCPDGATFLGHANMVEQLSISCSLLDGNRCVCSSQKSVAVLRVFIRRFPRCPCVFTKAVSVMMGRALPKQIRAVFLMIWFFSKSSDLGTAYLFSRGQEYDLGDVDVNSKVSLALLMVSWLADLSLRGLFMPG